MCKALRHIAKGGEVYIKAALYCDMLAGRPNRCRFFLPTDQYAPLTESDCSVCNCVAVS